MTPTATSPVYRSNATGIALPVPNSVVMRNTPLRAYGERLNHDFGIFVQDSWTMKRLTVNGGLRYEWLNAQVEAGGRAGRPLRAGTQVRRDKDVPNWKDSAPRFSAVYDLFGNSKTALKYSLNRYNQSRTTGIAETTTRSRRRRRTLTWTDLNNDDIAQGLRRPMQTARAYQLHVRRRRLRDQLRDLRRTSASRRRTPYGDFPRMDLEQGVEIQHELFPRLSVTGSWFHGDFHDLTSTINHAAFDGRSDAEPELHAVDGLQPADR